MGEICQWSDPDIAHMRYYMGPLKLKYMYNKEVLRWLKFYRWGVQPTQKLEPLQKSDNRLKD